MIRSAFRNNVEPEKLKRTSLSPDKKGESLFRNEKIKMKHAFSMPRNWNESKEQNIQQVYIGLSLIKQKRKSYHESQKNNDCFNNKISFWISFDFLVSIDYFKGILLNYLFERWVIEMNALIYFF